MIPPEKQPQNYVDPQQMIKDMLMEKHAYQRGYADAVDQMERDKKAQPKRQWVWLTEKDLERLTEDVQWQHLWNHEFAGDSEHLNDFIRAVEYFCREKNV
jgi:hypothetical protein